MTTNPDPKSFMFTVRQITDAADTWANFNGFTGETCHGCKKTANVLAGGPGWICTCGEYNAQGLHDYRISHTSPDLGPDAETIQAGYALSQKHGNIGTSAEEQPGKWVAFIKDVQPRIWVVGASEEEAVKELIRKTGGK